MKLRKEIEEIIESFDPFDENQKNVVRESRLLQNWFLPNQSQFVIVLDQSEFRI